MSEGQNEELRRRLEKLGIYEIRKSFMKHIFPYPSTQGSQVYVRSLLKGLSALGHQVSLLCYAHGDEEIQWDDPEIQNSSMQTDLGL